MQEILTDDLLKQLLSSSDPIQFADENNIGERSLSAYLQQLLEEKGLRRAAVVKDAQIGETYGYYIFTGQRHPKRDFVIRIAIAMGCTLKETNRLLQAAGLNELYCKNRRDVIIIFGIDHGFTLQHIEEQLYQFGEDTLQEEAAVEEGAQDKATRKTSPQEIASRDDLGEHGQGASLQDGSHLEDGVCSNCSTAV